MEEASKLPSYSDLVKPPGPVFLRKLSKKMDWGSEEQPKGERISQIIKLVFNRDKYPYSVYLIQSDEELHRVVIGMNGGRQSITAESFYIAIQREELEAAGIQIDYAPETGITKCIYTKMLHHDLTAEDEQLQSLCALLIDAGRNKFRFSSGMTKRLLPRAEELGCLAMPESVNCRADKCVKIATIGNSKEEGVLSIGRKFQHLVDKFKSKVIAAKIGPATEVNLIFEWTDAAGTLAYSSREEMVPTFHIKGFPSNEQAIAFATPSHVSTILSNLERRILDTPDEDIKRNLRLQDIKLEIVQP